MSTPSTPSACVVPPSGGKVIRAFGDEITVHLGGGETGGKYTMFTDVTPPGGGPPPHRHLNEDEWFYVLEGRAEFFKDGVWTEAPVGTAAFMPRGVVHSFRNPGDKPLRMLVPRRTPRSLSLGLGVSSRLVKPHLDQNASGQYHVQDERNQLHRRS